jgi:hypothetical protein
MNKLNEVVLRVVRALWQGARFILSPVFRLLGAIFGRWQPPSWTAPAGRVASAHPAAVLLAVLLAAGAVAAPKLMKVDWAGKLASLKSVQPDRAETLATGVTVTNPDRTMIESSFRPNPAVLTFAVSAAPLSLVGHEAKDVSMSPALAGKWIWTSPTRLEFTPTDDWPIGTEYTVTLGPKALAPHVQADRTVHFHAPRFEMKISQGIFYQDPVQVNLRKAVFEITFSHPVDQDSLEKRIKLSTEGDASKMFINPGDAQKFTVTFDKLRLVASVHSQPLAIPAQSVAISLTVAAGVKAQKGGDPIKDDTVLAMSVPGLYSLDVAELKQMVVTNDAGEPENVLQVATGMAVHEKEMARAIGAWLLPAKRPNANEGEESVWADPADVTAEVLKQSSKIALTMSPAEREIRESHAFKFAAEPGRYMLVRIQKGLKSAGGYQLGATRDEIFRIKRSAPELTIMSKGSLLAMSGEKKLPLLVRDLPGVRVEIGRLLPQQLQHLVTQSEGDMTKPEFYAGVTPDSLTERFEKKIPLKLRPGKTHYETLDFAEYLKADASDRRGVFILTVQGYDPNDGSESGETDQRRYGYNDGYEGEGCEGDCGGDGEPAEKVDLKQMRDRRLVIVTDLGIVSKLEVDGSRSVFVQSIHDGSPVTGAAVEVWGKNGAVLVSKATDAAGVARLPTLAAYTREKSPTVMVVKKGGDLSFLPLNRHDRTLDVSRFDVGGLHASELPNQVQAFLFSDRGIYRPGDTINIGIAAKSLGWNQKLADMPVEAEVIDARGLVVRKQKFKLGAGGMADFSHTTQDTSPTGNWTINLNLARDTASAAPGTPEPPPLRLGTVSVKVQEFMPDRTKVVAHLSSEADEGWVKPADLAAKVNVQNLFGTPAPKRRVEAQLTLSPAFPAFRSHPDYVFTDPQHAKEKFQDKLADGTTDDKGMWSSASACSAMRRPPTSCTCW